LSKTDEVRRLMMYVENGTEHRQQRVPARLQAGAEDGRVCVWADVEPESVPRLSWSPGC
jgi:hypothetical protein